MDLRFEIPAACADLLRSEEVDIGLVPVIELDRQKLDMLPRLGIASSGPVRSILLVSKVAAPDIRSLAADSSSRTSVVLAQILLAERFGSRPMVTEHRPEVGEMLAQADACLVIGDPALRIDRSQLGFHIYDLGAEWTAWTGLPMVYAVWAARAGFHAGAVAEVLNASWEYGRGRRREAAEGECATRGIPAELAYEYLTCNIEYEMSDNHGKGLALFRSLARTAGLV